MRRIVTDSSMLCMSVGLSNYYVLDGGSDPSCVGAILRGKVAGLGHAWTHRRWSL